MKIRSKKKISKKDDLFAVPESIVDDEPQTISDDENDGHDSLVKNLIKNSKLQTDFKWQSKRTEAKTKIDQHGISKDEKTRVSLNKLLKVSENAEGKKKLRTFEQKAVTAAPLKTPLAKKAARKANYSQVSEEITKYDPIVKEIRNADQIVFPLEQEKLKFNVSAALGTSTSKAEKPKLVSSLEKDIESYITEHSDNIETDSKPFTENELAILKAKSVEEARAIHREIQKRRQLISFQESKYRRMRKIKSKKYHRLLKKEKLKKTVEDFDKMVEESPDKAIEKLEELNKLRALERASLKHHNTGKWAKHQKIRAKYDENARNSMNDQLKISSEMMRKRSLALLGDGEEEEEDEDADDNGDDDNDDGYGKEKKDDKELEAEIEKEVQECLGSTVNNYNPWISSRETAQKRKIAEQPNMNVNLDAKAVDDYIRLEIERRVRQEKADERARLRSADSLDERNLDEGHGNEIFEPTVNLYDGDFNNGDKHKDGKSHNTDKGEEEFGHQFEEFDFHNNEFLREAFIDDDVVEEFYKEQEEQAKREQDEKMKKKRKIEILPGWGDWAGAGIAENPVEAKKVIQKEMKKQRRIDTRISNAIVLKDVDSVASKYRVQYRPATVCDAQNIEKTCAKPIGSTWNPQMVTKSMIEPDIVLPRGRIVAPMDSKLSNKLEI